MTRDEVIAVAVTFGFVFIRQRDGSILPEHSDLIEEFAALVADKAAVAEREACAKVAEWSPSILGGNQAIAAAIPHARLALVHGCGHMLTMEQPARVNALLGDWLAAL